MTERFNKSLFVLTQNLGPQLINRAQLGLTPGQVFMLKFIKQENSCSVSKLAEKLEVAPSAITVMLDRLENNGYVIRTRDHTDRRVVIIELTAAGEEKLKYVVNERNKIIQHCLIQLDANELNSFIMSLEKLASIAQTVDTKII